MLQALVVRRTPAAGTPSTRMDVARTAAPGPMNTPMDGARAGRERTPAAGTQMDATCAARARTGGAGAPSTLARSIRRHLPRGQSPKHQQLPGQQQHEHNSISSTEKITNKISGQQEPVAISRSDQRNRDMRNPTKLHLNPNGVELAWHTRPTSTPMDTASVTWSRINPNEHTNNRNTYIADSYQYHHRKSK